MSELIGKIRAALKTPADATSDFDLNPGVTFPAGRILRPAAVLLPILQTDSGLRLVLTKRSSSLVHHPGQISFPGGKVDPMDDGPVDAALREAREEIGLPRDITEVLGSLPAHETVTNFSVTPVVALVTSKFDAVPEPGEVAEVFSVPLDHVTNLGNFQKQARHWQGVLRYYDTVPYGPYYIWGATARILRGLAERLNW